MAKIPPKESPEEQADREKLGYFWRPETGGEAPDEPYVPMSQLPPQAQVAREERIRARAVLDLQREMTKQEELKLKQEEKRTQQEERRVEREKIKQRASDQPQPADPNDIHMEFAMSGDTVDLKLEFLVEPYLPRASIVGFYGRGETAKSSFIATMAAHISPCASTLWVSCEEPEQWVRARHSHGIPMADDQGNVLPSALVGVDKSMLVVTAIASKRDAQGRVIASSFDIWEHLQSAIVKAKCAFQNEGRPQLRLVVLDTAVGLTTWGKGESPNDDAAVKRLLGYLKHLAETHDVTIAFIGHANKGKHDYFADSVMGATAWVNTPRLTFMHAKHRSMEGHCIIRVAKSNVIPHMAAVFSIHIVKELHTFIDGPKAGLQKVWCKPIVWGATAAEELWEEATRKPDDDDEVQFDGPLKPMPTLVENAVQTLVELVMTTGGGQSITREDVEKQLGRPLARREWLKVDNHIMQRIPTVLIEKGMFNRVSYKRTN